MPLQKPRGRKQASHTKAYATVAVIVVLALVSLSYAYVSGYFQSSTSTTNSSTSSASGTSSNCPAAPTQTNGNFFACVNTSQGSFEIELFYNSAPQTVANFVSLARSGFYNHLVWHRIATSPAVIQTGDPLTRNGAGDRSLWGTGGSNATVPLEVSNSSLHNDRGYLGMARGSNVNSGTSQFYINTQNNRFLDGSYTVFGRVLGNGMNVVDAISALPISTQYSEQPANPTQAMLLSITILNT
jgi:cyclophilin family peptidyl-prolyl cis-trans isomerase